MLATAVAGFLASVGLLKAGLLQMWLRYPLSVLVAWGVFLYLVRQWAQREHASVHVDEELGRPGLEGDDASAERKSVWPGRAPESTVRRGDRSGCLDLLDLGGMIEPDAEGCLVFLAIVIVVGLAIGAVVAIGGLIMEAETLLATMASLMIAGILLQSYAPEAHSIGAVWRYLRAAH